MSSVLSRRLNTSREFPPGEELLLALAIATSDLGDLSVAVLSRFQLTHPQYNVLRMLAGAGERGMTHAQITQWMISGVPDVTRLVDRLEGRDLVRRARDDQDRRRVIHHLTPAGSALLADIQPEMAALHDWIEAAFPKDERTALVGLCERVIQRVAARVGPEGVEG